MWTLKHQISSKAVVVNDLTPNHHIGLFCLTETWLWVDEHVSHNESTPPSHIHTHSPQDTSRGGRVAAMFDSSLIINPKPLLDYDSFKNLILCLSPYKESNYCG